ncbi:putative E3 ubiquitin-protein ligase SINA-like protein 6 [Hordeum vulgare]|nr:putative E3 ubiquitin-protein ligase SINA-like protein 6 [Hordeum vulgare]
MFRVWGNLGEARALAFEAILQMKAGGERTVAAESCDRVRGQGRGIEDHGQLRTQVAGVLRLLQPIGSTHFPVYKWPHHMLRVLHQCEVQLSLPNARCGIMERVLGGMTTSCLFWEFGCSATNPFTEKLTHEESCLHALCHCPIPYCGLYANHGWSLHEHIETEHYLIPYGEVTAGSLSSVMVSDNEPVCLVLLDSMTVFLLVVERTMPSGCAMSVVQLVSEPVKKTEEKDFKYKIQGDGYGRPAGSARCGRGHGAATGDGAATRAWRASRQERRKPKPAWRGAAKGPSGGQGQHGTVRPRGQGHGEGRPAGGTRRSPSRSQPPWHGAASQPASHGATCRTSTSSSQPAT